MSDSTSVRNDFEDSLQRTAFAPTRYPLGDPSERATYTPVLDGDQTIGAVYITESGGLSTLFYENSGTTMTGLMHRVTELYAQGLSASAAYERLTSDPNVTFGDEDSANLSTLFKPSGGAVTAAADAVEAEDSLIDLPSGATDTLPEGAFLYVTEDDAGTVLDLVYSDSTDVYLRQGDATWAAVTGDGTDQDPIDGRVIVDVDLSYVRAYDSARAADDAITDADIEQYRSSAA